MATCHSQLVWHSNTSSVYFFSMCSLVCQNPFCVCLCLILECAEQTGGQTLAQWLLFIHSRKSPLCSSLICCHEVFAHSSALLCSLLLPHNAFTISALPTEILYSIISIVSVCREVVKRSFCFKQWCPHWFPLVGIYRCRIYSITYKTSSLKTNQLYFLKSWQKNKWIMYFKLQNIKWRISLRSHIQS